MFENINEFNEINLALTRHNSGDELLAPEEYNRKLKRSIEIITSMNSLQNPDKPKKEKKAPKAKPNPLTLDDL